MRRGSMQISSRFTIAVHTIIVIETFKKDRKVTSELIASSVNVNPVVIRRILQQLKKAGIIEVKRGSGGADLAKAPEDITLLDVYNAVESIEDGHLFHFHENPNELCPVGRNIHKIMDDRLEEIQAVMEAKMRSMTVRDIMEEADQLIEDEQLIG
jgi:Rrf2 family protein